ncbi:hypothetical protein JHK82_050127 [Glycine max]|nr:hypothetical protein JHK82_050127 [Glycine max]
MNQNFKNLSLVSICVFIDRWVTRKILPTNELCVRRNMAFEASCLLCSNVVETLAHALCDCPKLETLHQALMKQKQHIEIVILNSLINLKTFHGDDELIASSNKENFLELLNFLTNHNEVLKNTCGNLKLIAPSIQKDIVRVTTNETTKEQMVVVLHYVNKKGQVIECFPGLVHVPNTDVLSLKLALESLFAKYGLSLSRLRRQGYDGASNIQVANLSNIVGASCKHWDIFRKSQITIVKEALQKGEISISLFSSMIDVLEIIEEDDISLEQKAKICALLNSVQAFEFVFILHLMKNILGITHEFSQALQRKFSLVELLALDNQLENYFIYVCSQNAFSELKRD